MHGFLNIIKPPGMTSFDVIRFLKKEKGKLKIGHTGTLDPGAAGVLPLCLGRATRVAEYITGTVKRYRGEITLGIVTDTLDGEGVVLQKNKTPAPSKEKLEEVFASLTGVIKQVPPRYSAVKVKGKPLYEYAREGEEVKAASREVEVYFWKVEEIIPGDFPRVLFEVECSSGTYVRSLAMQAGENLGCGAYLSFLLREKSGPFTLEDAVTLEQLKEADRQSVKKYLISIEHGISFMPEVTVKEEGLKLLNNGNELEPAHLEIEETLKGINLAEEKGPFRIYDPEKSLRAIGYWQKKGDRLKLRPHKVLFWG